MVWRTQEAGRPVEFDREPSRNVWRRIVFRLRALLPLWARAVRRPAAVCGLVLVALLALPTVQAEAPDTAQVEVNYLLAAVAASDCDFYRNGSWYDAKKAAEHLRFKYEALLARNLIHNADEFIDLGATRSSMSGLAYEIRCPGTAAEIPHAGRREIRNCHAAVA